LDRLQLVAPSRWIAGEIARSSLLGRFSTHVIPNGIDVQAYAPRDKRAARDILQIPQDARAILFVTQFSLSSKLKGLDLLKEAIREMSGVPNLHLIALGAGDLEGVPVPHTHLGHIFNDNLLSLAYSAADVFVIPSLFDNLPNVVMESMACGTPVAGFTTGGIPEMVRPGQTGELAPRGDVRALREAIESLLLRDDYRAKLSAQCREIALKEYSLEVQAARYISLYQSMLQ
jgi:glycosyltransferase involved in cell wall biosynthesis